MDFSDFVLEEDLSDLKKDRESQLDDFVQSLIDSEKLQSEESLQKQFVCANLLDQYCTRHGTTIDSDNRDIIRVEFEISDDWDHKIQILEDALENGILLEQSKYYPQILEGVVEEEETFFK